jgi:hypothetical protein
LENTYHWTTAEVGVGYVVVGVAMVMGSLIGGRFSDRRRARLVSSAGEKNVGPESRLVDQIWGVFLCVAGLVMFGWFVDKSIHPAAVLISTFLSMYPFPNFVRLEELKLMCQNWQLVLECRGYLLQLTHFSLNAWLNKLLELLRWEICYVALLPP